MDEAERAYERALSFLEKRDRTEREVSEKLSGTGFSEGAVTAAIGRLRDNGFVNDKDYAARYLELLLAKGRGRLRIASDMRRKGLPDELVRNTLEDGLAAEDEYAMAAAAARRFWAESREGKDTKGAAAKVSRRLASLGFTWEVIGSAMRELRVDTENEEEEVSG